MMIPTCSVARELFLDKGARPRASKSGARNRGLRWNWRVYLSRKQAFCKKKGLRRIWNIFLARKHRFSQKKVFAGFWSVFLSQTWLTTQVSGGAKFAQGAKISSGGESAPYFPRLWTC